MKQIAESSPRFLARMSGLFLLLTIATGIVAQVFISGRLVLLGNASATANNILANKPLYQLGFAVYMIEMACNVTIMALFYELLRPVSKSLSLVSALLGLTGCVVKAFSRLFYIAPLLVLGAPQWLRVFNTGQLQALALLLLKIDDQGAAIGLIFFGFSTLLKGVLMVRATFFPRILGVLSLLGGVGWLAFLWPPLGYRAFPAVAAIALLGSLVQIAWLLVVGVNEERWREQLRQTS